MALELWCRSKQYLRENWGAPFVLAFIVLLITSGVYLSFGDSSAANNIAVYAFYALVLGVVLQIASYVKYGESEKEEPEYVPSAPALTGVRLDRKSILAIVIIIVILLASGVGVFYYEQASSKVSRTSTTTSTHTTIGPLSIGVSFLTELPQPNNAIEILLGINQTGGLYPFNYTAYWSDGVNQTNSAGVFIRSFFSNQTVPSSARIFVTSSDGQNASIVVKVPPVNRTTTTSTSTTSTSTIPAIAFKETGLPSGAVWSVSVSGSAFHSNSTEIVFYYPLSSILSYVISGPYDSKNFSWAFVPSPQSASFKVNGSTQISISFSNQTISTPSNQTLTFTSPIVSSATGPSSEQVQVGFHNSFPSQIQAIVFATATNNHSGAVSVATATISPNVSENETASLVFNALSPGNYAVSIFAESSSGVILSETTNSTFTLP